jgi:hypothetical protein
MILIAILALHQNTEKVMRNQKKGKRIVEEVHHDNQEEFLQRPL